MASVPRFFKPPNTSFFLFGPRGTGKTFWFENTFKGAITINLILPDIFRLYSANPERLIETVEGNRDNQLVIIDEIQKVPDLLQVVHYLIEKRKGTKFILTGSSARKLKRSGVNLLGGRALLCSMHPFMAGELAEAFDFNRALRFGTIPLIWFSTEPAAQLKAYNHLYLREEILQEGLIRNTGNFSRFLETMTWSHGNIINMNNISRECEVPRKTVEGYIDILEDLMIGFRLPVFRHKPKRSLVSHSKFYFFDPGIFRSLKPAGLETDAAETEGGALEGLVVQHLRAWNAYQGYNNELFFWRTQSGVEVDVVVAGNDGLYAIEVKNSNKIHPHDLRGLTSFCDDYPGAKPFFLYRGKEILKKGKILCIPSNEFLINLHPDNKIWE